MDPDWHAFVEYCRQDVAVEIAFQERLSVYDIPDSEWDAYALDQKINDNGIMLDLPLVHQAIACDQAHRKKSLARAQMLTGLENPNSPLQLKAWLAEHDCHIASRTKADMAPTLPRPFSGKIICSDCRGYYGSKAWHAGPKYEKPSELQPQIRQ